MTGTNHGMTGALIALTVKEPSIAVPLSFASHFVCDAIPHHGLPSGTKLFSRRFNIGLIADFIVAVLIMAVLGIIFEKQRWIIWSCMVAAASPDLMWAYYNLYIDKLKKREPVLNTIARFHKWIQWSETPKGWFIEGFWIILFATLIFRMH